MSDLTLNRFLASGTAAEREAFTPDPPTPASGPDPGYTWYETDTGQLYSWDGSAWQPIAGEAVGPPAVASTSFLQSGGQVTWDSGFTFRVSAAVYYIGGVRYESAEDTVTLGAADPTNPRIDVIALNTSLAVVAVAGTAAAAPSEPSIDPGSQLKLAIVSVPASATEPATASSQTVYLENAGHAAEWDWTASGASIVVNSTNNPRTDTTDIEGTNVVAGVYAQGEKGAAGTIDPNAFDHLRFFIRSKATWNNNRGLLISLRSAGVLKGSAVQLRRSGTYGFASSNTADYQQIAIPITDFAITQGTTINQVRIEDFGGAIGFYIDDITFQVTGSTPSTQGGITELTGDVTAGPGSGSQAATIAADAVTNAKLANMAEERVKGRAVGAGTGDPTDLTPDQVSTLLDEATDPFLRTSAASGGGVITGTVGAWLATVDDQVFVECPYAGTITAARIAGFDATGASVSGSAVVDIWLDSFANFPPTVADTITASAKPTLTTDPVIEDTTLTGWDTAVAAGDWFVFKLESMSTAEKVLVQLTILRS